MFIEFLKEHYLACIVVFLALAIFVFILTVVIVKAIKKQSQARLERMLAEIPIIPDEEVATTEVVHENRREGNAELIWVREQSFGEVKANIHIEAAGNEDQKQEKKPIKTVSKTTDKTSSKTKKYILLLMQQSI